MTQASVNTRLHDGRESRDRALFDDIAERYAHKDEHPAASVARRQRLLRTIAAAPLTGAPSILEAGCGAGYAARYLEGRYSRFVGIDYAEKLIDHANNVNALPNARFQTANIKSLDLAERFDAVVMIGVLHHLDDIDAAMDELVSTLKPGGWLIANEPQPGNPLIGLARRLRKRMDRDYSEEQDELSANQLRGVYQRAGLVDIRVVPQGLFSTPFAEVPMGPTILTRPLAKAFCLVDTVAERALRPLLGRVTWNLIVAGRRSETR